MRIVKVPRIDYRNFIVAPRKFLRDTINVSGKAEEAFILFPDKVKACFEYGLVNPFDEETLKFDSEWIPTNPSAIRFMHIDLAQNRCGVGISCCHVSHIENVENKDGKREQMPFIQFDFVGSIKAERGEEIIIQDVENIIYYLSGKGLHFGLITFDRFQSVHLRQRLTKRGYIVAQMSVERCSYKIVLTTPSKTNMDGYKRVSTEGQVLVALTCFKDCAYMNLLAIPFHELAQKEVIKSCFQKRRNKIVPLPNMTIDIFHSMGGSILNLMSNTGIVRGVSDEENELIKDKFYETYPDRYSNQSSITEKSNKVQVEDLFYVQDDYSQDDYGYY